MRNLFGHALSHPKIWQREIVAGITAFFAISYIIIVNPLILADAGIPVELSVFATIFSSVIGCLLMAFVANAPIVLTPGMGINAFFTYTICVQMGLSWHEALAISLVSGLIFAFVACSKWAARLSGAVAPSLKCAITAGIGLFLVEIGLEKGGFARHLRLGSEFSSLPAQCDGQFLHRHCGDQRAWLLYGRGAEQSGQCQSGRHRSLSAAFAAGGFFEIAVHTVFTGSVFHVHDYGL